MGRTTGKRSQKGEQGAKLSEPAKLFLEGLATRLLDEGVHFGKGDVVKACKAIKEGVTALPDSVPFKSELLSDIDQHVDWVVSHVVGQKDIAEEGLGRYPFNLLLETGLKDSLDVAKTLPPKDRRNRYRLLLASSPSSNLAAKIAEEFFNFEAEEGVEERNGELVLRSLEVMCAGKWSSASICAFVNIFYRHYSPLAEAAVDDQDQTRLDSLFSAYRMFLARTSLYVTRMDERLVDWPATLRQQYYSLMAAVLAQYTEILLALGESRAEAMSAASQLAALAIHFLALSFEHLLDMLLSLSAKSNSFNSVTKSVLHAYVCVLSRMRGLERAFADGHLYGKLVVCARRAKLLADSTLSDMPAVEGVLRDCLTLPVPESFATMVPSITSKMNGTLGLAEYKRNLVRYILYKSTGDELETALEELAASIEDSPEDDNDAMAAAFFIDATGATGEGDASRDLKATSRTPAADGDLEAELQAEIDAMLGGMARGATESDEENESEGEGPVISTTSANEGDIIGMLNDNELDEGEDESEDIPATRNRRATNKRQPEVVGETRSKRARAIE